MSLFDEAMEVVAPPDPLTELPFRKDRVILAIDPGTEKSAFVIYSPADGILAKGHVDNSWLLGKIRSTHLSSFPEVRLVIEKIESMGMAVGQEVFETVWWTGRFCEAWEWASLERFAHAKEAHRLSRRKVKLQLCGTSQAKDPNIRAALIDRLGKPGKPSAPGPTFGVSGDMWAALAVAVTWHEIEDENARF